MLYSTYVLLVVTIVIALMLPCSAFFSFRIGYKTGRAIKNEKEIPRFVPTAKPKGKDKPTEEQRKLSTILSNIDTYDGSKEGQVKI